MKIKHLLFSLIFGCAFMSGTAVFALDTNEAVSVGLATDFEAYYGKSNSAAGNANSLDLTVAGGILNNLSYFVNASFSDASGENELNGVGLNLLWTVMETENMFAFDIMPFFAITSNEERSTSDGSMTYPNGKDMAFGADLEFNLTMLPIIQPYFQVGFTYAMFDEVAKGEDDYDWAVPMTLGFMHPVTNGVEFLLQFSSEAGKSRTWETTDRTLAAGLNIMYSENLEVITEAGWNYTGNEFLASVGLIYSI